MTLTTDILERAKLFWILETQRIYFAEQLKMLKNSTTCTSHVFNRLTAFVDINGIVRVGGRLHHAQLPYTQRHPAILPRSSHLTTLIIENAHERMFHGGTQVTLAHIRQEYWIIGGRAPVKSHIL